MSSNPGPGHLQNLLAADEPAPFCIENADAPSPFLLICDHAGTRIPQRLGSLGLQQTDLLRHIGWDIGAAALTGMLAQALNAAAILQPYSRLVIDCNRPPHSSDSIVALSEDTPIPGNQPISAADAAQRHDEIFAPYHARIRHELDTRVARGQPTVLIAMHSFTPVYLGQSRPWHAGVLYNRDMRLAQALRAALLTEPGLVIGDNQPYNVSDDTDYSIPEHGERRGLAHVELEIRQDLIGDEAGQRQWCARLARLLPPLLAPLLSS